MRAHPSVRAPTAVDMPYELMLAHFEIGRLDSEIGRDERADHLQRASRIASELGVAYDDARAQSVLEELPS